MPPELFDPGARVVVTKTGVAATVVRRGPFAYGSTTVPETWVQLNRQVRHPVNRRYTDLIHCRHLSGSPAVR